ncbi:hypothetical protein J2S01_002788 [Pectinatus haikarae]|uniref:Uncharacterized protein n=1 Tax=Pectinatus haikarae TaxID=349096 RepID=A0ABT9YC55_9FIRM|nr:hypothetical protein [Pectinatus haikarae]
MNYKRLDKINNNDVREMRRATQIILRELDRQTDSPVSADY